MRKAGRIITVINVSSRVRKTMAKLNRGYRNDAYLALFEAAADLAETDPDWYKDAIAGNLMLGIAGDGR